MTGKTRLYKRIICELILELKASRICLFRDMLNGNYFAPIFILFLMSHKQIKEGITIIEVKIKKVPQFPFNQSTRAPEDEARVVLPAVPIDASKAY